MDHLVLALTRMRGTIVSEPMERAGSDPEPVHDQLRRRLQQVV